MRFNVSKQWVSCELKFLTGRFLLFLMDFSSLSHGNHNELTQWPHRRSTYSELTAWWAHCNNLTDSSQQAHRVSCKLTQRSQKVHSMTSSWEFIVRWMSVLSSKCSCGEFNVSLLWVRCELKFLKFWIPTLSWPQCPYEMFVFLTCPKSQIIPVATHTMSIGLVAPDN